MIEKPIGSMWSNEQWQAIVEDGKNILVSAGAGSGKTAVLTTRIIEKLKKNISLKNLIVLTFTNAAAKEMKQRVNEALKKNVDKYPKLKDELAYIDEANIMTFDALFLMLVKKYYYLLGLSKKINIIDKNILMLRKKEILTDIFENSFDDQDFVKFIDDFSIKNYDKLIDSILNISSKMELLVEINEAYNNTNRFDVIIDELKNIVEKKVKELNNMLNINGIPNETNDYLTIMRNSLSAFDLGFEYYISADLTLNLPRFTKKYYENCDGKTIDYIKDLIDKFKKEYSSILELLKYKSIEEYKAEYQQTQIYQKVIIKIIKEYEDRLNKFKYENNAYEFMDISKLAIKLLEENEDIRLKIVNETNEILIDEYQDTSNIQEYLISLISNNNVYMVGDVKQSIYRFRNANPYIFKNKYDNYSINNGGIKIDLIKNFRSRNEVLDNINLMFSKIMYDELGGIDYNNGHQLQFGNKSYLDSINQDYNLNILEYNHDKLNDKGVEEAFIIADDILKKINDKMLVFDKSTKTTKEAEFKDFTILCDNSKNFELFKKIFEYKGIPLQICKNESFVNSNEVYAIRNIIKCVNNFDDFNNNKLFYMGILRSFLVEKDDQYIFNVINNYYNDETYLLLKEISNAKNNYNLKEIIDLIYEKFDIYNKITKLSNVNMLQKKLLYLQQKALEMLELGYNLSDFDNYFDYVIGNSDIEFKVNYNNNNVVKIMTIHGSKGLEFNFCYFANMTSGFNFRDYTSKFYFDDKFGIICPYYLDGIKETFAKKILVETSMIEEIAEKIRLLYVALTRAKEQIIIVCPIDKTINYDFKVPYLVLRGSKCLFDFINPLHNLLIQYTKITQPVLMDYNVKTIKSINGNDNPVIIKNVKLTKTAFDNKHASKTIKDVIDPNTLKIMEMGTLMHEYFEIVDFKNYKESINNLDVSKEYKDRLFAFFNKIDKSYINVYKEYYFTYVNEYKITGIIDLLLEYEDYYLIIDYKLSNTDSKEYVEQLRTYYNYLKTKTTKKVKCVLYSIYKEEFKEVVI